MRDEDLQKNLQSYLSKDNDSAHVSRPVRLIGGYDTDAFKFTISTDGESVERVVRRYPPDHPYVKPIYEGLTQNKLNDQGFPVPRVFDICTNTSIIGGAFILMEFAEGKQLLEAPDQIQTKILGRTHALLHNLDSSGVHEALSGVDASRFLIKWRFSKLESACQRHPHLREVFNWLSKSQPKTQNLSVCHGDFHKLNILCDDDCAVTAVLDWSGVVIADPEFDIAQTVLIFGTLAKYLNEFEPVDHAQVVADYLHNYRKTRKIDDEKLEYYLIARATMGLAAGLDGQDHWSRPGLMEELQRYVVDQAR